MQLNSCNGAPLNPHSVIKVKISSQKLYRHNIMLSHTLSFSSFFPVVCDLPCENGVCVENDTCKCTDAFSGPTCSTPGMCTFSYIFMLMVGGWHYHFLPFILIRILLMHPLSYI